MEQVLIGRPGPWRQFTWTISQAQLIFPIYRTSQVVAIIEWEFRFRPPLEVKLSYSHGKKMIIWTSIVFAAKFFQWAFMILAVSSFISLITVLVEFGH